MWSIQKPSARQMQAFAASQQQQPFSYPDVGASQGEAPPGYDLDHNRIALGSGRLVFAAACRSITHWRMFPRPWTEIHPADQAIRVGNVVVMLAHVYGLWWMNCCRIVYVIEEPTPCRCFGFAYGTLPGHVECGEERFSVEWDDDDVVWYDLRAFSRPRYWLARLGYPLVRRLQRRFVAHSQRSMRQSSNH